ncbi:hypothetical protein TrRE_jg2897 [Triparma retinervis]|uniref:Uncharacterized protein n=1 Tax=Triparma retinervis TaxID=2557542 RepID=A0A9W7CKZ1_9STRA|nr:hypothetical protein TrRE_jg2897 [Triparma retinervis]
MSLKWVSLTSQKDLGKASSVQREVDDALRKFNSAMKSKDHELVASLRSEFEARIDVLEDFFALYDDDNRAVLFEKQRGRLRHAIQSVPSSSPSARPSPTKASQSIKSTTTLQPVHMTPQVRTPATGMIESPSAKGKSVTLGSVSKIKSSKKASTPKSVSPRKNTRSPAPLYSWETAAVESASPVSRSPLQTPHGTYIPSLDSGFYELRGATPSSNKFIDFQLVMTAAEYAELLSRRRMQLAGKRHTARFKTRKVEETPFLNASTPYVDPNVVQGGLYRSG